jgi:hypothetical protein
LKDKIDAIKNQLDFQSRKILILEQAEIISAKLSKK